MNVDIPCNFRFLEVGKLYEVTTSLKAWSLDEDWHDDTAVCIEDESIVMVLSEVIKSEDPDDVWVPDEIWGFEILYGDQRLVVCFYEDDPISDYLYEIGT